MAWRRCWDIVLKKFSRTALRTEYLAEWVDFIEYITYTCTKETAMMTFRMWLQAKWYEHIDELIELGMPPPAYNISQYFNRYRWWLRREYRYQRNQHV